MKHSEILDALLFKSREKEKFKLHVEAENWLAANHCIKNSTTAHWSVVFPDQATALMFRLTWYR